jgi:hypothetical protein
VAAQEPQSLDLLSVQRGLLGWAVDREQVVCDPEAIHLDGLWLW